MKLLLLVYSGNVRHLESKEILGKTSALSMTTLFLNLVYIVVSYPADVLRNRTIPTNLLSLIY